MFYDYQKILSYNALINILLGERGVGKTYGASKFVLKRFKTKGKKFAYIRRFKTELTKARPKFMTKIQNDEEFKNDKLSFKGDTFLMNDKVCGYSMTLTEAQNLKGSNYDDVDTIIFDEFIIEDNVHHYLKDEVTLFLGLCETLMRLRDFRCFLLANSVTITNPYFLYFDLTLPYNNDIKTFKNGLILLQYMKNEEYRETKHKSRFGQLVSGTPYEKYAIDNSFLLDNNNFIEKKQGTAKFSFAFIYQDNTYGVWFDYKLGRIYVSNDYYQNTPYLFSCTLKDHTPNTMFLNSAKKYSCWKNFIENYQLGNVRFESIKIKNAVQDIIKLLLTK